MTVPPSEVTNGFHSIELSHLKKAIDQHSIIAITDVRGKITYVNDKFCEISKYSREELIGQDHRIINSGFHSKEFIRSLWKTIGRGETWTGDIKNRNKHGGYYWVATTITPILGIDSRPEQYISIRTDITDQRNAQESIARYAMIIECSTDGIVGKDLNGVVQSWNKGAEKIFGYTSSEMIGNSIEKIIPNDRRIEEKEILAKIARGEIIEHFETVRLNKNGSELMVSVSVSPVKDVEGRIVGASKIVRNITERSRLDRALRESEERFRQLAESIDEVFWVTDPEKARILYISPAYEKIWGRTCESVYEKPDTWIEAIHPEDRMRVVNAAFSKQEQGTYDEVYRIQLPDGTLKWIHDRAFPVTNELGQIYRIVGIAQDITNKQNLESQLRQAQKMEAIGTLAGGIAHDFNNVLGAISGYVDLCKHVAGDKNKLLTYLDQVSKAGRRAADLVSQILTFSRQEELDRRPIHLSHVVQEACALLRASLPSTISLSLSIHPDTPIIIANDTQIHQVIMNLATNAWQAMGDNSGTLSVGLRSIMIRNADLHLHEDLKEGEYALLSVSDSGAGMSAEVVQRIFDPFFTTKAPGKGTGLGLSVVHGILKAHSAVILVESAPNEGTRFDIYFPSVTKASGTIEEKEGEAVRGHGERILFVDDELMLCHVGKEILELLGYVVDVHTDAVTAFEKLLAEPTKYDLIMVDFTMPNMIGTEFSRQAREVCPSLPVILMTGYAPSLTRTSIKSLGIDELILKPFSQVTLGKVIAKVLNSRSDKKV